MKTSGAIKLSMRTANIGFGPTKFFSIDGMEIGVN